MISRPLRTTIRAARRVGGRRYRLGTYLTATALAATALTYGEQALERWDVDPPPVTASPGAVVAGDSSDTAVITRWRDADTFESTAGPIRLENIEAPEDGPHDWKCDDANLAAAALAHAQALAPVGSQVTLRYEGRMSWDRHIAWATLPDGTDLGDRLLATGTVTPYPSDGTCPGGAR